MMKNILQHCLFLIRFLVYRLENSQKVGPYQKLRPTILWRMNLIVCQKVQRLSLRKIKINEIKIVNKYDDYYMESYHIKYRFELLLRGSRDGLIPKKFHGLCQYCYRYDPLKWEISGDMGETYNSFMFSVKK
ncbi:hypothetical protein RhiirA4_479045 [Rhizophagus irregularis]|uniref:Uncharacterized protein n=1 Tax=Rhizophagus irregularis TaxID=588596 RepID=A0A2I1HFU5_9GLOM|nr:hypothetical protein RhiirA4_479045 [Rhizophagus irregularis]